MKQRTREFYDHVSSEFAVHLLEALNEEKSTEILERIILKTDWYVQQTQLMAYRPNIPDHNAT